MTADIIQLNEVRENKQSEKLLRLILKELDAEEYNRFLSFLGAEDPFSPMLEKEICI